MGGKMLPVILAILGGVLVFWGLVMQLPSVLNVGYIATILAGGVLLLYGLFFHKINEALPGWLKVILFTLVGLLLAFMVFLFIYGQIDSATGEEDAVIVLGSGLRGEALSQNLKNRLDAALDYLEENDEAVVVVSGGQGRGETIPEAEAMKRYLVSQGISEDRILKEDKSTSTEENLKFSKEILDKTLEEEYSVVVVSTDFHLFRAGLLAADAGLSADRKGAKLEWYMYPMNYLREVAACLHTFVSRLGNGEGADGETEP